MNVFGLAITNIYKQKESQKNRGWFWRLSKLEWFES